MHIEGSRSDLCIVVTCVNPTYNIIIHSFDWIIWSYLCSCKKCLWDYVNITCVYLCLSQQFEIIVPSRGKQHSFQRVLIHIASNKLNKNSEKFVAYQSWRERKGIINCVVYIQWFSVHVCLSFEIAWISTLFFQYRSLSSLFNSFFTVQ